MLQEFGMVLLKIAAILALVLLNGFFVACEFALVKVRETKIDTLAEKGDIRARIAQSIVKNLSAYLPATQLGITIASLGLGWLGEPLVANLLTPALQAVDITSPKVIAGIAVTTGFVIITSLHIVIGELVPKSLAIQRTEGAALWLSIPLKAFYYVFYPAIHVLNLASGYILKLLNLPPATDSEMAHSPEELRMIVNESRDSGQLSTVGAQLMQRVLTFTTRTVKDIMVPKTNMVGLDIHAKADTILEIAFESAYSRMPVYDGTLDKIVGVVYIKDFLAMEEHRSLIHLTDILRTAYFIPETMKVGQLLRELQRRKYHMAIVVDEYGVTTGLVTMEDVLEEIVGEIQDEYDTEEERVQKLKDGSLVVDGTMSIHDLTRYHGIKFPETEEFESVSGFLLSRLGKIPTGGETVRHDDQIFTVVDVASNRIKKVKIVVLTGTKSKL